MFTHNFKYTLKTLFKDRTLIFWTFAFPIILGTFFNMAFSNIENSESLNIIDIAIVENEEFKSNEIFTTVFENLSDENSEDRLFNATYTTEEKAKELLENKDIIGYMKIEEENPKVIFNINGIDQTVFKYVVEEITQTSKIITEMATKEISEQFAIGNFNIDYDELYDRIIKLASEQKVELNNISNKNLSYTMIEFYTLIAMTCLYGGILGVVAINKSLANMSPQGKRVSVAPTKKHKVILSSVCASYLTQLIGIAILFVYTIFVLKVDYGNNLGLVVSLALAGCLAGLSIGTFVGTIFKTNENTKTGIIISITMLGCFLSGMMGITMKYIIDKNIPIINKLNPASMITDGFYSLYYYDTLDRYIFNLVSLLIFSAVLIIISYISIRRQKYDSI